MADTPAAPAKKSSSWIKAGVLGILGLGGGVVGTYATAVVNKVVKPSLPVANFATAVDGMTLTCQNRSTGENGWWDFGDGSPLEPFSPDQPSVTHTFAKAGTFPVKLTVRNFLSEENERSVPVEVGVGKDAKEAPAPFISAFAVQPVSPSSVAPATFRVTAEMTNANHCVWDFGDGRVEVSEGGKVDRLVTFEKAGAFNIQAVAHNGKQVVKQAAGVKVDAPKDGTLMVVLKVTDRGSKLDKVTGVETVAVAAATGQVRTFTKTVAARPGYSITTAVLANPTVAGIKDLKVQVADDKRSVKVTGEWAGDTRAAKAGGSSDAIVALRVTQERATPETPAVTMVTGTFMPGANRTGLATLPLPPAPFGWAGLSREYQIEVRALSQTGSGQPLVQAPPRGQGTITLPWTASLTSGLAAGMAFQAKAEGNTITVMSYTTTPAGVP